MTDTFPTDEKMAAIADSMGISLYQRFNLTEASLFLRCSKDEIKTLVSEHKLDCIQVVSHTVDFFGYQLLDFLLGSTTNNASHKAKPINEVSDRIIRISEVEDLVGLSRTTIWRRENTGEFPKRVPLGGNRVGWKLSEVNAWVNNR